MKQLPYNYVNVIVVNLADVFVYINENLPKSIFDVALFKELKYIHDIYSTSVECFLDEGLSTTCFCNFKDNYWGELKGSGTWLSFGISWGEKNAHNHNEELCDLFLKKGIDVSKKVFIEEIYDKEYRQITKYNKKNNIATVAFYKCIDFSVLKLSHESERELKNYRSTYDESEKIHYIMADICADNFARNYTIDDAINDAYLFGYNQPYPRKLQVFFHESSFTSIRELLKSFFDKVKDVKHPIYINSATVYKDVLYFMDYSNSFLYKMDIESKEVIVETILPSQSLIAYSSMVVNGNDLWIVPYNFDNQIYVYDIEKNTISRIVFPEDIVGSMEGTGYRKAATYNNCLWLIQGVGKAILSIDMNEYSVRLINDFPQGVSFDDNYSIMFKNISIYHNLIYLYADGSNQNLIINADTYRIEKWDSMFKHSYGFPISEDESIILPVSKNDSLIVHNRKLDKTACFEIPNRMWRKDSKVAFWNACRIGGDVFILPHEADGMIVFNIHDRNIRFVDKPLINYTSLTENREFAGYDVIEIDGKIWIIPYLGNHIFEYDYEGNYLSDIKLETNVSQYFKYSLQEFQQESFSGELAMFVGRLVDEKAVGEKKLVLKGEGIND